MSFSSKRWNETGPVDSRTNYEISFGIMRWNKIKKVCDGTFVII